MKSAWATITVSRKNSPVRPQGTIVPSTSLSRVDAVFPVIEVLSIVAVATVKIPPPAPMLSGCVAPLVPLVGVPLEPPTVPPVPAVAGCSKPGGAASGGQRFVAGNQVRCLGLLGTLLRLQPWVDHERRGVRVVNAAADAEAAEAAVAAVSAGGIAPAASDRSITAETARARSTVAAAPASPTEGLIRREVDGDPGERCGAVVVEAAAVAVAGPAALAAEAA